MLRYWSRRRELAGVQRQLNPGGNEEIGEDVRVVRIGAQGFLGDRV